jgi:uncharacterized membrane-anchored protein YhcB (DUF1043 family)
VSPTWETIVMAFLVGVWVGGMGMALTFILTISAKDREKQKPTDG